jgi:hypothetical protein
MNGKYGRRHPYYGEHAPVLDVLESGVLNITDFTNNDDATGYVDIDTVLPIGAIPLAWKATVLNAVTNALYEPADGSTIAFVYGGESADTITDSASSFVAAGFEDGDTFTISGSTSNDGDYEIVSVTAGTITLATGEITAAEDGIDGISFIGTPTATVSVGVSGDLDRFSADTAQSVAAAGTVGATVLAADACKGVGST